VTGSSGLLDAQAQASDTGGDNNGFEVVPVNGFTDDTAFAVNFNGPADRHRYYDYGLAVPPGCRVLGIAVRLDWWLDATAGVSSMSVELSWDGGTTWTALKTDAIESTLEHTTTLGGASDTWGRTWSPPEVGDPNFRVRLVSNSTAAGRDFFLDWAGVELFYGP
jgi:hypothetical protein